MASKIILLQKVPRDVIRLQCFCLCYHGSHVCSLSFILIQLPQYMYVKICMPCPHQTSYFTSITKPILPKRILPCFLFVFISCCFGGGGVTSSTTTKCVQSDLCTKVTGKPPNVFSLICVQRSHIKPVDVCSLAQSLCSFPLVHE